MATNIQTLAAELKTYVPAISGFPADSIYEDAVRTALVMFNQNCPRLNELELTFTDALEYTIPDNLVFFTDLSTATYGQFVYNFNDLKIKFASTPVIQGTFTFKYAEGVPVPALATTNFNLDIYQKPLVILFARFALTTIQANQIAQNSYSYTLGTQSLDRRAQASDMRRQAETLYNQFITACQDYNRPKVVA
jgi:hypothetical protein